MTNRKTGTEFGIDLDTSDLLILNGGRESDALSAGQLLSGVQNGTKVSVKPTAPEAPLPR